MKIMVTGGAGFIGSAVIRNVLESTDLSVVNVDKLTYAGNLDSLAQINLIVEAEKLFKVKFSVKELSSLKNVGEMIDLIIKKNEKL